MPLTRSPVMYWAPRGTPDDVCLGVDEYIASRAGPSPTFIVVNQVFFYGFLVFSLFFLGLWIIFRKEPRLQSRSFSITFGAFSVVLLSFVVICARRTTLGANGGFAMGCQVHFWLYTSMGSMQSTVGLLRLIQLLNTARFNRGARKLKRIVVDDESRSQISSIKGAASVHVEDISAIFNMARALAFSFGFGAAANRIKKGSERQLDVDHQADILALELSSQSLRASTMFVIFFIVYLPTIICIIAVFSLVDPYKSPACTGCDMFSEELICVILLYALVFVARLRIASLLKGESDPDGVIAELRYGAIFLIPCLIIGITLLIVDPNYLDYNMVVAYEWFLCLGLFLVFFLAVPLQIILALHERRMRGLNTRESRSEITPFEALKDPVVFSRFETFAENAFCSESARFLADAWGWKGQYNRRVEDWRRLKAKAICNMYIRENSLLQINIPAHMRVKVEQTLDSGVELDDTIFDPSIEEILLLIKWNFWSKFVHQGGVDDFAQPLRAVPSALTVHTARTPHNDNDHSDML